jgi:hypothetical protein
LTQKNWILFISSVIFLLRKIGGKISKFSVSQNQGKRKTPIWSYNQMGEYVESRAKPTHIFLTQNYYLHEIQVPIISLWVPWDGSWLSKN